MEFRGKTALITGSGTGIGKTIAQRFAKSGASVIILGRRSGPLEEAAVELRKTTKDAGCGGDVHIFAGVDVSDAESINAMFDGIKSKNIGVDFLVNNAGVSGPVTCFANAPKKEFDEAVAIHLTGTFWTTARCIRLMERGAKIVTISTFFTEERPLEQRPYRFRTPYTASQGAKNRLAEALSWELVDRDIASIATNPGPVHSDRIYKTVYPKAAAEFMRVGGFEDMTPERTDLANMELLPLLGEDDATVKRGIGAAAGKLGVDEDVLLRLLEKIQSIAEKIQKNTSHMIANREFLSQEQVADMVLNLCGNISGVVNGKVIPGDRVFYPVRAHIGCRPPSADMADLSGKSVITVLDGDEGDLARDIAGFAQKAGGKAACLVLENAPRSAIDMISDIHHHVIRRDEVGRLLGAASSKLGSVAAVVHLTGDVPDMEKLVDVSRSEWDAMVERFVTGPADTARQALGHLVPGGDRDPRLYRDARGTILLVGPGLPAGKGTAGLKRAHAEVFRGALRPFTVTANQELSEVLKSRVRIFTVLPGAVSGVEPDRANVVDALNYALSPSAPSSAEVVFCADEVR